MTAKEIREMSLQEIEKKLSDTRSALLSIQLKKGAATIEKSSSIREQRRDIARMETILLQKKRAHVTEGSVS
ncbi:MAG: 50S ribosomal protein L29 [Verrucomicrobia bacterium GWF2_51_19]|nr:MAG: 50S ribosomal protein L29 [Verrucomicrobia bacterium GWF2_51_19]HCJ12579.1 50S ribosomal protein L29 [Opitutae bacterium]